MPDLMKKVGFAFSSKDRTYFTRRSLRSIDQEAGYDLLWVDGSDTQEGKELPFDIELKNARLVEVNQNVKGGPDAAIKFGLHRLLDLGYDYCGLIENDVEFKPGWFRHLLQLFELGDRDKLNIGAASVRSIGSRVLVNQRDYSLLWNAGAGMILFTREAAEQVLSTYGLTTAKKVYDFYKRLFGIDVSSSWELFMNQFDRPLGADWSYAMQLYEHGFAAACSIPSYAFNMDCDVEKEFRTKYVTDDHEISNEELKLFKAVRRTLSNRSVPHLARFETNGKNIGQRQISLPRLSSPRRSNSNSNNRRKILLVRSDSIGDSVIFSAMLPHLREKYSGARIAVVCQAHIAELYSSNPFVDAVFPFDRRRMTEDGGYQRRFLETLQSFAADLALNTVFSRDTLSDFITLGSNAKVCVAFRGDLSNISAEDKQQFDAYYNHLIETKDSHTDEFSRMADYLEALGIHAHNLKTSLPIGADDEAFADKIFNEKDLDPASTFAVFPKAQYDIKDYPHIDRVLHTLSSETDFSFIGLGSTKDIPEVERALSTVPENRRVNLSGKTTLLQMAAILKRCRLAFGVDTAAAHMACAVGTPNVVILGGGQFGRFLPYSPLTSVIALPLDCYNCNWKCKFFAPHCTKDVDPEVVTEAVRQSLISRSDKPRIFVEGVDKWQSGPGRPKWQWFEDFIDIDAVDIVPVGEVPALPTAKDRLLKAEVEITGGNLVRASHILGELLKKHADDVDALNDLAVVNILQENYDKALDSISKALSLQSDNQVALGNLKYLQSKMGSSSAGKYRPPVSEAGNHVTEKGNISPEQNGDHARILVSAIVSTYNSAKYIRGCLDDLINQTLYREGQLEIIVVNSGSQENEEDIVDEYLQKYPNIRYLATAQRETVYQAWNRGIKIARGKYVTNANTDDRHREDALRRMANLLDADDSIGLVYADQFVTRTENETYSSSNPVGYFNWPEFDRVQLIHCACCGPQPMWRRSLHDRFGYFDERLVVAADYEWWLRISDKVRFKHIPEKLGLYLLSPGSVEHSNTKTGNIETRNLRAHYARQMGLKGLDYNKYKPTFLVIDQNAQRARSGELRKRENSPTVSVILPTRDRPDFLRRSLQSILSQTFQSFEIIVVNDAGADLTNVIDEFHDERIKYFEQGTRKRAAGARNIALNSAKGKYVAYLDDDDIYYPNHLETLVNFLEANPQFKFAYSDAYRASQVKNEHGYETLSRDIPYSEDFSRAALLVRNYIPILCIMHRREILEDVGLFDESLATQEDWDLWIRMSRKYPLHHIKEVTCEFSWRTDGSSTTSASQTDFKINGRKVWSKYSKYFTEETEQLIEQADLQNAELFARTALGIFPEQIDLLNDLGVIYVLQGRIQEAVAVLKKVISIDPENPVAKENIRSVLHNLGQAFQSEMPSPQEPLQPVTDPNESIVQAEGLIKAKHFEEAETLLKRILAGSPSNRDALNDLAVLYSVRGNLERAIELLNRLVELDPSNIIARKNLGNLYVQVDRVEDGLKQYLEVLKMTPDDIDVLLSVAGISSLVGKRDDAISIYRTILKFDPQNIAASKALETIEREIISRPSAEKPLVNVIRSDKTVSAGAPKVSVIIPVFNKVDFTKRCVDAVYANTHYPEYEIIIVDNGSTDGTGEYLRNLARENSNVKIIDNKENQGYAKANNRGAEIAIGDYLLLLNNDTEPQKGWMSSLVRILDADPSVGAAGSKLLFPDGTIQHAGVVLFDMSKRRREKLVPFHIYYEEDSGLPDANELRCYQALTGASLLLRWNLFEELGGFDERFWNGYEDVDLCLKIREKGYELVYQPESVVIHYESQSGPERFSKLEQNAILLNGKWEDRVVYDGYGDGDGNVTLAKNSLIRRYTIPAISSAIDRSKPLTSIVILTFNQLEYTKITLDSIRKHTKSPYEIIVVDNASSDGTVEYLKSQKDIRTIINEQNVGFPAGCNQGIEIAKGDYIVLLNNDVIVTDDWLEGMIECSNADPKIAIVGPMTNWISGFQLERDIPYKKASQVPSFAAKYRRKNRKKWIEVPRIAGFCMLIKREAVETIGGLDTVFGIGNCEDDDYCLRAKLAGFKVALAGDVFIHHFGSKSFSQKGVERYLNVVQSKQKLFEGKWGITPSEWWRDGKEPTKMSELMIPLDQGEATPVLVREAEPAVSAEQEGR